MTDQEIYNGIIKQDNQTFLYLYEQYQGKITNMVRKNNGNEEDAYDIFQEGLIALWTNIKKGKFEVKDQSKISTYLFALCRNIWISKLRKKKIIQPIEAHPALEGKVDTQEMEEQYDRVNQLEKILSTLGTACQKILQLFYYQKASLKEIAQVMEITEKTAKNTKYRCMQNLRANYKTAN
ncbi:MAG: sigma-70 family RNA polymerase sigma factor [Bacteroidota bacterium]